MQAKLTGVFVLLVVSMSMGQDHEQIEKYFFKIDLDDDKSLTTQELAPFIKSSCQDITDDQLQTLIDSFDVNRSGAIEFDEFFTMVTRGPVKNGSYSYTAPDGTLITVNWVADENGFQATGDHLPVAPPMPDCVVNLPTDLRATGTLNRQEPAPMKTKSPYY